MRIEQELQRALEQGELRLHYQPSVDLATGQVVGAEALVRWEHPNRGLIEPDRFLGVAEETGLIVPLGDVGRGRGVPAAGRVAGATGDGPTCTCR